MNRSLLLMLVVTLSMGLFAAPSAFAKQNPDGFYLSKHYARVYTKQVTNHLYGFTNPATVCTPQNGVKEIPGYWYHRWTCIWVDIDSNNGGQILIIGGSGKYFHYKVIWGMRQID